MTKRDHPHLLLWYVSGTLEREEAARIEEHLRECADCRWEARALASNVRTLLKMSRVDHVDAEELAAYDVEDPLLAAARRSAIELHLHACQDCREDLATLQSARRVRESLSEPAGEAERWSHGARSGGAPWKWALAGGGLIALSLAIAVAPRLWRSPREPDLTRPASAVSLSLSRKGGNPVKVLEGRGPWALTLDLQEETPSGIYKVRIENDLGTRLEGFDAPARGNERGGITILLDSLPGPGSYRVVLERPGSREADYSFWLVVPHEDKGGTVTWP